MNEKPADNPVAKFIARVERLEKRYKGHKYANDWLVPKEELIAVRDALVAPRLFEEAGAR